MDIFKKCSQFKDVKRAKKLGFYSYFQAYEPKGSGTVNMDRKRMVMLSSNNYLGLDNHPKIKQAAIAAIRRYGLSLTGSRFLSGTSRLHQQAEEKVARFKGEEAALVFGAGYMMNVGTIPSIANKNDVVISDEFNHASIIDGCKLARTRVKVFKHNDMKSLERVLKSIPNNIGKLMIVESVYSMHGDIANIPVIKRLAKKYNARLMIDEAHSMGVFGKKGRGILEYFNMLGKADIVAGTFSKSTAAMGGYTAARKDVVEYIRHNARSMIFSAAPPPAVMAGIIAALDIIQNEPERRQKLFENTNYFKKELHKLGFSTGQSQSPILPVHMGDSYTAFRFAKLLLKQRVIAHPVVYPAVPKGESIIRCVINANHSTENLDKALRAFRNTGEKLGLTRKNPTGKLANRLSHNIQKKMFSRIIDR
jgi:8-amino-7-oxononanoate synthase